MKTGLREEKKKNNWWGANLAYGLLRDAEKTHKKFKLKDQSLGKNSQRFGEEIDEACTAVGEIGFPSPVYSAALDYCGASWGRAS